MLAMLLKNSVSLSPYLLRYFANSAGSSSAIPTSCTLLCEGSERRNPSTCPCSSPMIATRSGACAARLPGKPTINATQRIRGSTRARIRLDWRVKQEREIRMDRSCLLVPDSTLRRKGCWRRFLVCQTMRTTKPLVPPSVLDTLEAAAVGKARCMSNCASHSSEWRAMCPIMGLVPIRPFQGPQLSYSDRDSRGEFSAQGFCSRPYRRGDTPPTGAGPTPNSGAALTWALGGGLDPPIAPLFAWRVAGNYLKAPTLSPNGVSPSTPVRFSTGLVFRF